MSKEPIKKAVALKYDQTTHQAPHVVAKGSGAIADKIIEQASKHHVKLHHDDALMQLLYQLDLNDQIPSELYPIIAEIFAMIYQAEQIAMVKQNE